MAQSSAADYTFLVASGFLCDPADSATCPAVARSTEGDTYELSGAGTFERQSKSVTAAGTFTHKSADGTVLATGVWVASELVRFESYGIVPGARMRQGRALGGPELGTMHLRMHPGSMPAGGLAAFRIALRNHGLGDHQLADQIHQPVDLVPFLELANVVAELFGEVEFRFALLDVGALEILDVVLIERRFHRPDAL